MTTAAALLKNLSRNAKPTPPKGKTIRCELEQTKEARAALTKIAPLNEAADLLEEKLKQLKSVVKTLNFAEFAKLMWKTKAEPNSLDIFGDDGAKAMFTVVEKYHLDLPEIETEDGANPVEPEDFYPEWFHKNCKMSLENAEKLVKTEIDFVPTLTINITEQMHGLKVGKTFVKPSAQQEAVTKKLLMWLNGMTETGELEEGPLNLTLGERELVKVNTKCVPTVMPGFMQRICQYCTSEVELLAVLKVFKPEIHLKAISYHDGATDHNQKLYDKVCFYLAEMLGVKQG